MIKTNKLKIPTALFVILLSLSSSLPAQAADTATSIPESWREECNKSADNVRKMGPKFIEILKSSNTLKLSKSEKLLTTKSITRLKELDNFDCNSISQEFWDSIKDERYLEIEKALINFNTFNIYNSKHN